MLIVDISMGKVKCKSNLSLTFYRSFILSVVWHQFVPPAFPFVHLHSVLFNSNNKFEDFTKTYEIMSIIQMSKNLCFLSFFLFVLFYIFFLSASYPMFELYTIHPHYRRVPNQPQIPAQLRQQINQQIGQAVTNAAVNELSNVFASKFK